MELLLRSPYPGMLLWFVLYVSDYYLTLISAKGYKEMGVFHHEKSFELTPQYQTDINDQSRVSRLQLLYLSAYTLVIFGVWHLSVNTLGSDWLYAFLLGSLLLMEVAVHNRHLRNLYQLRVYKWEGGVSGSVTFTQRFSHLNAAFDLYLHALVFFLYFLLTLAPFFLGGAFSCLVQGGKQSNYADKAVDQHADSSSG